MACRRARSDRGRSSRSLRTSRAQSVPVQSIDDIVAWLQSCEYVTDLDLFHERDFWQHPGTFERLRRGDCEDFALWAWRKLAEVGIDAEFCVGRVICDDARSIASTPGWSIASTGPRFCSSRPREPVADDSPARGGDGRVRAALCREPPVRHECVRRVRIRPAPQPRRDVSNPVRRRLKHSARCVRSCLRGLSACSSRRRPSQTDRRRNRVTAISTSLKIPPTRARQCRYRRSLR